MPKGAGASPNRNLVRGARVWPLKGAKGAPEREGYAS
jgi:hypothetical protein